MIRYNCSSFSTEIVMTWAVGCVTLSNNTVTTNKSISIVFLAINKWTKEKLQFMRQKVKSSKCSENPMRPTLSSVLRISEKVQLRLHLMNLIYFYVTYHECVIAISYKCLICRILYEANSCNCNQGQITSIILWFILIITFETVNVDRQADFLNFVSKWHLLRNSWTLINLRKTSWIEISDEHEMFLIIHKA